MNIRVEVSSLASHNQSGVPQYVRLLSEAIIHNPETDFYGYYFDFLDRQPNPNLSAPPKDIAVNKLMPLRLYAKAQSFGLAPPFDILLPKVDLTILPNFATWPTIKSKLRATVIHDLTYLYHPEVVEEKNLAHLRRVVPRSIKEADFIITVSESVKAELIKEFQLDPNRCVVTEIPPAAEFHTRSANEVHKKYSIPTKKYIYFIGNLEPRKNLATLLEAYLLLPNTIRSEYSLILAGSKGWKNESLQAKLKEAEEAGENVRHIGFIDQADSPALYQQATVFVMPSLYEGFGIPVLEAMLSGCPVIASDIPVLREVGGSAASYFNPTSSAELSKKIHKQLQQNTTEDWKNQAKANAARFSWDKNIHAIAAKTNELLAS